MDMAPAKLLGILLLLLIFLKNVHSSHSKKTIKIHVPYYVKHIHHYKKVYVPKVQVVKHEHLHKKEHEHHHHHDHHGHHHGYDKSSNGAYLEDSYESYYDEIDHKTYSGNHNNRLAKSRQRVGHVADQDKTRAYSSEELSSEEDYVTGPEEEGTLPARLQYRPRPTPHLNRKLLLGRTRIDRTDINVTPELVSTPISKLPVKRVTITS